jgi:hypothetical protein
MLMRSEAPHFWRVFLTNAEINRLGTLETAETGQPCATVGYLCQEQLQKCEAARVKAAKRDNIEWCWHWSTIGRARSTTANTVSVAGYHF